jgi:Predicted Zn-dependent proteases and their inactivated homologs
VAALCAQPGSNYDLYGKHKCDALSSFAYEVALHEAVDTYCRDKDAHVVKVRANIALNHQRVEIHCPDGQVTWDDRPVVRVDVSVILEKNGRRETGHFGYGGRVLPANFLA